MLRVWYQGYLQSSLGDKHDNDSDKHSYWWFGGDMSTLLLLTPHIGTPFRDPSVKWPYTSAELLISGRMACGTPKKLQRRSSQATVSRLISIVLCALLTSVT